MPKKGAKAGVNSLAGESASVDAIVVFVGWRWRRRRVMVCEEQGVQIVPQGRGELQRKSGFGCSCCQRLQQ